MVDASDQFLYSAHHMMRAKRHYLTQTLREATGSVVQHGILKGYKFGVSHWAEPAVGSYLLGTYEVQVCAILDTLKSPETTLIDIGAADGLYGIGLVSVGAFGQSLCFEVNEKCQQNLRQTSVSLGLENKISIYGEAKKFTVQQAIEKKLDVDERAVIICDIEGGEFDLFDQEFFQILSNHHIIIETHDFLVKNNEESRVAFRKLKQSAADYFHIHEIKDGLRYIRDIPLLKNWSDADTWSICIEGRKQMMTWLYLRPMSEPILSGQVIDMIIYEYQRKMFE